MRQNLSLAEVEQIYRDYGHLLLRRCQMLLRDDVLAEDALQEAFIKIMRYGTELRLVSAKLRWLYRVCDRCCFDLHSRRRRPPNDAGLGHAPQPPVDSTQEHSAAEARHVIARLLQGLSSKDQSIAVMAFVDGMSQAQIAQETGYARQTVNKRLGLIRAMAKRMIGGRAP